APLRLLHPAGTDRRPGGSGAGPQDRPRGQQAADPGLALDRARNLGGQAADRGRTGTLRAVSGGGGVVAGWLDAPSTTLRVVPLPRRAVEETRATSVFAAVHRTLSARLD